MTIPVNKINVPIPHAFVTRPYQKPFFSAMKRAHLPHEGNEDAIRRAVLVWHRRAGKEKTCWNYMILKASQRVGTYYYLFPTFAQGRKVLWDFIDGNGFRVLDHIPEILLQGKVNNSEMKIRLKNGSLIQVVGTDNIDTIVGTNPIGCIFSEYSLQDPEAWTLLRPILTENKGWAVFNFTPRGQNHAKQLYDMALSNPAWYCQRLTVNDTKDENGVRIISDADIDAERQAGMSEDYIQQEFYCSFTLGVEGSYYAKYMEEAKDANRIGNVPYDKQSRVNTAWDLGYGDSTAIIFFQLVGKEIHVIDYVEDHGEGLPYYAKILRDKPYVYDSHYAPHDIESHAFSSGFSGKEVGASLGLKFITLPTLKLSHEDGVEAVRGLFPRVWIDAKACKKLILALQNYRKEFDAKHSVYKLKPRHDWTSHGADAFRYMALGIRKYADSPRGLSDEEVDRMMDKYQPVFER